MSKNIILDGQTYNGVSEVSLPVSGGTALFKDKDEIVEPSGTKTITANGNGIDVTNYAAVDVNVQGGATPTYQEKTVTENGVVTPDEGYDALSKVTVNVSGGGWLEANAVSVPALKSGMNNGELPENIVLNMPLASLSSNTIVIACGTSTAQGAWYSSGCKNLTLNVKSAVNAKLFLVDKSIETVTVNASDAKFGLYRGCFFGCPNLTTINGTITSIEPAGLLGNSGTNDVFYGCAKLANVTFAPNIINSDAKINIGAVSGVYPTDNFTDATLISLANALKGAHKLTISATAKSKLATIMGNVTQVTEGDVTYDFFTADASGETSLESFITTTKGWTLG